MTTAWNQLLDEGCDTYVTALDIAGAFDRVWHRGIIAKLHSLGIDDKLLSLLHDYRKGRSLQAAINGHTSEYPVEASVPQGSVLGPLLWNVYFDDILQLVPQAQAYADDCTLSFTCRRGEHFEVISKINETLELILAWGKRWQVTLAPEKTQLMVTTQAHRPAGTASGITLGGRDLVRQEEIEVLGVKINRHMTFTGHVKNRAKRAIMRASHFPLARYKSN